MKFIDYNGAEQLKLVDDYVSKLNEECAHVLSAEIKKPDFDVEDFILQQNQIINKFSDVLKHHIEGYSEMMLKFNSLSASFRIVYEDNKRLQDLLRLNFNSLEK